ncbi:MAG: hypothetical protein ABIP75_17110 [Pyrinomonadaceae bacterium]
MANVELDDLSDEAEPEGDADAGAPSASVEAPANEAFEPVEAVVDPLSERLAQLKAEALVETVPAATVLSVPGPATEAPTVAVSDQPKKRSSSGGRVVASSRGSSRWSAVSKPAKVLTVDPALRFLLVTVGLIVFSLLVYLLSRYIK